MCFPSLAILLASAAACPAVGIRVATYNIGAHFTTEGFPDYSLGDPGSADHDKVRDVLARIDADVVALQEIASADVSGAPDDLDALAASLGYPHIYVAPVTNATPLAGPIDTSLRVAFLSRYPFLSSTSIRSPEGAKEITRLHPVVRVNVPGTTNDPLLISAHLKSGTAAADKFRRAIDMRRLVGHLGTLGLTNDDNYIILGDFNLSSTNSTYSTLPADLPVSYDLGADIVLPVSYSTNPLSYFSSPGVTRLDPRQLNGSASTFQSGSVIDLLLVSPAIAGRAFDTEIYNSTLDASNTTGLLKAGSPLAATTSAAASDHYAVFADFELDSEQPDLALAVSAPLLEEGLPDGTASATAALPAVRPSAVTVTLASDDPGVTFVSPSVVIPAGSVTAGIAIRAPRNFIADPPRTVTLTANASGYDPDSVVLQIDDVDGPYTFTAAGQTVTEAFTGFGGGYDPAPWVTAGGAMWQGVDSGASGTGGWRSYGGTADSSLGFLPQSSSATATAVFVNGSAVTLTGFQIAFDVEQWRAALNGAADSLSAEIHYNGQSTPLPALSHAASRTLPSGAVAGGLTTSKSTTVSGLSIPPGASFELRVRWTPGQGGGALPDDVFVNEFHYDNTSTDTGEFVEVAVGPGHASNLQDVSLVTYNGSNGQTVSTHTLDTFTAGATTASGHRLFSKFIAGLQNDSEGFAVTVGGTVLNFISYEGTFPATNGPAAGMNSLNIGVTQSGGDPVGQAALGRSGSGGSAADFTWMKFSGIAHSPGQPNQGQTFVLPVLPPQGLAIDNLSVTAVSDPDYDGDGLANSVDPDDDNDGQSDADEIAFGTNPLNAASVFKPVLARAVNPANGFTLGFPGAAGITYVVETSTTLGGWSEVATRVGSGQPIVVALPLSGPARFYRVRVGTN